MTTLEQTLPKLNREMDTKPQEATLSTSLMDVSRLLTTKTMGMELSRMFLTLEPHHMDQPLESQLLLLRLLPAQPLLRLLPQLLLPVQLLLLPHLLAVLLQLLLLAQLLLPMAQSLS